VLVVGFERTEVNPRDGGTNHQFQFILSRTAETVEFRSSGSVASGYLVTPASGSGPGVLVIQEWWDLDAGIKEMADRLGAAGFVALAPDLYHGELAAHDEMDKAAHLVQGLPPDRAARDMSGAIALSVVTATRPRLRGSRSG
jgi:dienelactone hydrolase